MDRGSNSFYWRMLLETKIWVLDVLFVVTFMPSQLSEQGNICVYTNPYIIYMSMNISICNYIY